MGNSRRAALRRTDSECQVQDSRCCDFSRTNSPRRRWDSYLFSEYSTRLNYHFWAQIIRSNYSNCSASRLFRISNGDSKIDGTIFVR